MRNILILIMMFGLFALAAGDDTEGEEVKKDVPKERYVQILMETTMGNIVLELDQEKAPITVANFLSYVEKKAYDGTIFHRVIPDFMAQGGGFAADMKKVPTDEPIQNEWKNGLKNGRGTIAMARLGGQPHSATNQFFINVKDNIFLDKPSDGAGYAVFGKVVEGMEIVDKIVKVETVQKDNPLEPIIITKVTVKISEKKTDENKTE